MTDLQKYNIINAMINDQVWHRIEPEEMDRILSGATLFYTGALDLPNTVIQLYSAADGYTTYGIVATVKDGKLYYLRTECVGIPTTPRYGLDEAIREIWRV